MAGVHEQFHKNLAERREQRNARGGPAKACWKISKAGRKGWG